MRKIFSVGQCEVSVDIQKSRDAEEAGRWEAAIDGWLVRGVALPSVSDTTGNYDG